MKLGLITLLVCTACTPHVVPWSTDGGADASTDGSSNASLDAAAVTPDAQATPCEVACRAMAAVGCPEGTKPNCASTCEHLATKPLTTLNVACLAGAKSMADVRHCGVACTTRSRARP